jgi:putative aminopeptidase FrvX
LEGIDYVLVDESLLADIGAKFDSTKPGSTPDVTVNQVHEEVGVVTANRLLTLVQAVWESINIDRCEKVDVIDSVGHGFQSGFYDRSGITNEKMRDSIQKLLGVSI